MSAQAPPFEASLLVSLSSIIAVNLTGTQIAKILADSKIADMSPELSKEKRLYNAFANWQNIHRCSNHILVFISNSLQPVLFIGREQQFHDLRIDINKRLSFAGLELNEKGKFLKISKSTTITEAEQRANRFKHKLESRNIHQQVFKYCNAELLVENYFHSVFEAVKSIADRIRINTGLKSDGAELIDKVFATDNPLIKINNLSTSSERSEHLGLANLIKGLFGLIRNPTAHEPKIKFPVEEEEAVDIMMIISFAHKRLDKAKP